MYTGLDIFIRNGELHFRPFFFSADSGELLLIRKSLHHLSRSATENINLMYNDFK